MCSPQSIHDPSGERVAAAHGYVPRWWSVSLGRDPSDAGLLILLFAQPVSSIIELTVDQVSPTDQGVFLHLGTTPLLLPDPVDQLVLTLITEHRGHSAHGRRQRSPWLFPGARPGQHISQVANRPVCAAIGVTVDGHKDVLGLWMGVGGEGAKFS